MSDVSTFSRLEVLFAVRMLSALRIDGTEPEIGAEAWPTAGVGVNVTSTKQFTRLYLGVQ